MDAGVRLCMAVNDIAYPGRDYGVTTNYPTINNLFCTIDVDTYLSLLSMLVEVNAVIRG